MTIQTIKTNTFILQMGKPRLPVPQMGHNQAGGGPLPYGTNHLFPIRIPTSKGGRKRGELGRAGDEGQTRGWLWTGGRGWEDLHWEPVSATETMGFSCHPPVTPMPWTLA